jgi:hypothetical protein
MTRTNLWKIEREIKIMIDERIWDNDTLIELRKRLEKNSKQRQRKALRKLK